MAKYPKVLPVSLSPEQYGELQSLSEMSGQSMAFVIRDLISRRMVNEKYPLTIEKIIDHHANMTRARPEYGPLCLSEETMQKIHQCVYHIGYKSSKFIHGDPPTLELSWADNPIIISVGETSEKVGVRLLTTLREIMYNDECGTVLRKNDDGTWRCTLTERKKPRKEIEFIDDSDAYMAVVRIFFSFTDRFFPKSDK
jgi:predicted DNA-binding protein